MNIFFKQGVTVIWKILNWLWWFGLRLSQFQDRAAQYIVAHVKSGRKRHKKNHLASFTFSLIL